MTALTRTIPQPSEPWRRRLWAMRLQEIAVWALLALLALFLGRAPLAWCAAAVLGVGAAILFLLRPAIAAYLLAFSVPFGALWSFSLLGIALGPSEALLAVLLASWLVHMAAHRQVHVRRSALARAMVAYLFTILLSFLPAHQLPSALKELFKWLATLLVFLYVSSNAGRSHPVIPGEQPPAQAGPQAANCPHGLWRGGALNPQTLMAALLLGGMLQGLLGIYQFLYRVGPPGFMLFGRYMRAAGTFGQPNPYGGYMGLLVPVAYALVFTRRRGLVSSARRGDWAPLLLWVLALAALPVMSAALIMSWSRGALLGLVGGLALVILALGWRVWLPLSLALALLLLAGSGPLPILPSGFVGRALEVTDYLGTQDLATVEINDGNFAVIERLAHWRAAWLMFERQPWLGVGAGQYADEYPAVALPRWQDPLGHAHNYILHVMAEGGLLGLAGYLLLSVASFAALWRAARTPASPGRDAWSRTVGLAALGMWGHLMAHNLFDNLYVHGMYLLVAMMLGLAVAHSPANRIRSGATRRMASYPQTVEAS